MVRMLTILVSIKSNSQVFLLKNVSSFCKCKNYSHFSAKYTERKKKRRVNFILKFHSSLKKFVKYFTMITKRYMYGTKVPNFIGL